MDFSGMDRKRRDDEVSLWTVAIGEIDPFAKGWKKKAQEEVIEFIKTLSGFVGVHPVIGSGTLLLFRSEEQAKDGRQKLKDKGCPVGDNGCMCYVEKKSVVLMQ